MKQFLRFIFIVVAIFWIPMGFLGVGISANSPSHTTLDIILDICGVLFLAMVLFLIARWLNKGKTFKIKNDSLYVVKNMGIGVLLYLGVGLLGRLLYFLGIGK